MKRLLSYLSVLFVMVLAFPREGVCRESLYETLSDAKEVNVYVEPIVNSSDDQLTEEVLKIGRRTIEDTLKTRQTINFKVVQDPEDADIMIKCDIFESVWMDTDPIDTPSLYGAIADAAIDKDYARIRARVSVVKGPRKMVFKRLGRNPVLMEKDIMATHEQFKMTREECTPIIAQDLADNIMKQFFSKKAGAPRRGVHTSPISL